MTTATYSPEDNKIRLRPAARLSPEDYAATRAAGFAWAPKQEIFVAPMWTPGREDFALSMAGEIGDEDTTLVERAEARAERFGEYSDKRAADSVAAKAGADQLAGGIPFGQPILIGHYSERRARKDAERIESGLRKAVKMWETSEYWTDRAAGAVRAAKYKELPAVRARRIKKLEAEKRSRERDRDESTKWLTAWSIPDLTLASAIRIANFCRLQVCKIEGRAWSSWEVLQPEGERYKDCPAKTVADVVAAAQIAYPRSIAYSNRWIAHIDNRLAYEKAMLGEAGGTEADKVKPEKGGAVRYWVRDSWSYIVKVNKVTVSVLYCYNAGGRIFQQKVELEKLTSIMTKAQVDEARAAGRLIERDDKTGFYLSPAASEDTAPAPEQAEAPVAPVAASSTMAEDIKAMRATLKAGIEVVAVPTLFPTPRELAERMVELAAIGPDDDVLEPSAGTGAIVEAMRDAGVNINNKVFMVEINPGLAQRLANSNPSAADESCCANVLEADFLECNGNLGSFDRILMNPPFDGGADIKHIKHALTMLRAGGRLVAICAGGPRQRAALEPLADTWEELAAGTFKQAGTNVNTVLLVIER